MKNLYALEMKIELEKEKKRAYDIIYRNKNKKRLNKISRDYYYNHLSHRKAYMKKNKIKYTKYMETYNKNYRQENKEEFKVYYRNYMPLYKKKNKTKVNARNYARLYQRGTFCEKCGSEENLTFHHTNYKKRKGITVCKECHKEEHRRQKS
jgi:hypothetical protein